MKSTILSLLLAIPLTLASSMASAAGPFQHSLKASQHTAQAIAQTSIAGVKVVTGVVALPLMAVGEVGQLSGKAGGALWDSANEPIGEPLNITDEVITVSPAQAMQKGDE